MYIAPPSASAPHPYEAPQHPEEACEWPCEASSSFVKLGRPPALSCGGLRAMRVGGTGRGNVSAMLSGA